MLEGQVPELCRSVLPISSLSLWGSGEASSSPPGLRGGSLEAIDLSRHRIFNLKHFPVLLAENANQEVPVCMSEYSSIFLPVIIRSIMFSTDLAYSDTATSEGHISFDKCTKTQLAKSCLDVQHSHPY